MTQTAFMYDSAPDFVHFAYHFTGKERDQESGNNYFEERYFSSGSGRFLTTDPGNIGADPVSPQRWNMYSYSLNNPLSTTDPTGMYVCEDIFGCSSPDDQAFGKALSAAKDAAQAASNEFGQYGGGAALQAINAYGSQGVDNGVNVRFDSSLNGGVTEVSGVANGNRSSDNPNGQNINVTFNPEQIEPGLVAHEGSHIADGSAWAASRFSSSANPSGYLTEQKAYHVQFDKYNHGPNQPGIEPFSPGNSGIIAAPIARWGGSGGVSWPVGAPWKLVMPDVQNFIESNYSNLGSSAFAADAELEP